MVKQTRYSTQVRGGVHEPVQGLQQLVGRLRVGLPALGIATVVWGWPQPEKDLGERSTDLGKSTEALTVGLVKVTRFTKVSVALIRVTVKCTAPPCLTIPR
jgi:hypothetical protein